MDTEALVPISREIVQQGTAVTFGVRFRNNSDADIVIRHPRLEWIRNGSGPAIGEGIATAVLSFRAGTTVSAGLVGALRDTFELCRRLELGDEVSVYIKFDCSINGVVWKPWGAPLGDVEVKQA